MSNFAGSKELLFLLFCIIDITTSKRLRSPGFDDKWNKLNECAQCKVLTGSFNHWIEKTSRGKYEGGDAAWEESKLKSYARSEVRLVEIQEGLCSELSRHQDYCYSLSEEAELVLEKWWFHEDPSSIDLDTWLCIETLKYCCPPNHFGDNCTPCPQGQDLNICSGHGKCDGDGTRKGNGTCICKKGYMGKHCETCAENFYTDIDSSCVPCHKSCMGCSGKGPYACHSCKPGWMLDDSSTCIDINECLSLSICKYNELCINMEGSYRCKDCDSSCASCADLGANNCTSCESLKYLWGGMCITRDHLEDILIDMIKRLCLYLAFIISIIITLRKYINHNLTAILLIIIAVLVYYFEMTSNINTFDLTISVYQNYDHTNVTSDFYRIMRRMYKKNSVWL